MRTVVSCSAVPGAGGLGRHLEEVLDAFREQGVLDRYYAGAPAAGDEGIAEVVAPRAASVVASRYARLGPATRSHLGSEAFDVAVARRLAAGERFVGFGGQALRSVGAARRRGYDTVELVSGNSHLLNVERRHREARSRHPLEESWFGGAQLRKTLREYEVADRIYVNSQYSYETFVEFGVNESKLRRFYFRAHPRYVPADERPDDGTFRVVYVGSLTVAKGVPLLVEAFAALSGDAELTLVGGWSTRGMRRFLEEALRCDPRIRVAPGDPLPHLQVADVCVHPSYEDGFAYAPAEALACATPVIVSADTGMKELVRDGVDGLIVPTGDRDALVDALAAVRSRPLAVRGHVTRRESA